MKSPRIEKIEWGEMIVEGFGSGRDFKLYCGGGREWDWSETNTHHDPGIQLADVQELLDAGAKTIVLSPGMQLVLRACPDVFDHLRQRSVRFFMEETRVAVKIYNELAIQGEPVGGLFHSTC
jgi:hypothetical protein